LPFEAKPPPEPKEALAISEEDLRHNVGVYQNGDQRFEIVAEGNRLLLKPGPAAAVPLVKRGEGRYALEGREATEFAMVAGANGRTEYLHSGSRSYARVGKRAARAANLSPQGR
jgi:hypothetical protein